MIDWVPIALIIVFLLFAVVIYIVNTPDPILSGGPKVILSISSGYIWYENVIRYLLPNASFVRSSQVHARDEDIVVFSEGEFPPGNKGYRILINAEPYSVEGIHADLIIDTVTNQPRIDRPDVNIQVRAQRLSPKEASLRLANRSDKNRNKNIPTIYMPFYAMTFLEQKVDKVSDLKVPDSLNSRSKFAVFAYSNCNEDYEGVRYRQSFFDVLERVVGEHIDAPGKCKNNMKVDNAHWTKNVDLFKSYKFVIAVENSLLPGYITEKMVNPLLAGAVPIYLGAPDIVEHFNPKRFINVRNFPDMEACARYVLEVHTNDKLFEQIRSAPPFLDSNPYLSWIESGVMYPELKEKLPSRLAPYLPLLDDLKELDVIRSHELGDRETFHYINLDRCRERDLSIVTQSREKKIPVKRITAYDRDKLSPDRLSYDGEISLKLGSSKSIENRSTRQISHRSYYRELLPGEIGCYLSHISLWLSLLRSDLPYLAIIEDDAFFAHTLKVSDIVASANPDWDILYLGYNPYLYKGLPSQAGWYRAENKAQPCLAGYIINRRCALFLLKNSWPLSIPIDELIRNHFENINAYIHVPAFLSAYLTFDSTIRDHETIGFLHKDHKK